MRWHEVRTLAFDTESTGVDPAEDRIIEFGVAEFSGGRLVRRSRDRVNPGRPIPVGSSRIHGIMDADVAGCEAVDVLGPRCLRDLVGAPLIGFNAHHFDVPLINAEMARVGATARIDPAGVLDVILFARWHHRDLRHRSLVGLCAHYNVTLSDAHRADADAAATGELLLAMVAAGTIPDDVDVAFRTQVRLAPILTAEWAQYGHWIYGDRETGAWRVGAGRSCGTLLSEVESGFLGFALNSLDNLTPDAAQLIRAERERRRT